MIPLYRSFSRWNWVLTERRFKRRDGITINHGQPRNKARAAMAKRSRRINRN